MSGTAAPLGGGAPEPLSQAIQVEVFVVPVATPSPDDSTTLPTAIGSAFVGDDYYLEVWMQQSGPEGIVGGSVDVQYTTGPVDVVSIVHKDYDLPGFETGTIDDAMGLVDDLGGGNLAGGLGASPAFARLAYVQATATGPGDATYDLAPGATRFAIFGQGNIEFSDVDLTDSATVTHVTPATVAGRFLFYNNSAYDSSGPMATLADGAGIDTSKSPLEPGNTATFANYSGYTRGFNGLIVDIANAPADGANITPADFSFRVGNADDTSTFTAAPAPSDFQVFGSAGPSGEDRVVVTFADNAIEQTWLETRVLVTANTGLVSENVFYFGNQPGEVGNLAGNTQVDFFDVQDQLAAFTVPGQPASNRHDVNKSAQVDFFDVQDTLGLFTPGQPLNLITPTGAAPPALGSISLAAMPATDGRATRTADTLTRDDNGVRLRLVDTAPVIGRASIDLSPALGVGTGRVSLSVGSLSTVFGRVDTIRPTPRLSMMRGPWTPLDAPWSPGLAESSEDEPGMAGRLRFRVVQAG